MKARCPTVVASATFLLTCLVECPANDDKPLSESPTASQILERLAKAYASCKTYRDSGTVKTAFHDSTGNWSTEKRFRTAFARPDRFRFEYQETTSKVEDRYVIWCHGKEIQTWWSISPGIDKPDSLGSAIGAAIGVSGGSSHTIPALLLPTHVKGWKLSDLKEAKRVADEALGKSACFKVQGKSPIRTMTVWIDKESSLTRRIDYKGQDTTTTVSIEPVLDEPVNEKLLAFDVPKQK